MRHALCEAYTLVEIRVRAQIPTERIVRVRGAAIFGEAPEDARQRLRRAAVPRQMAVRVAIGLELEFRSRLRDDDGTVGALDRQATSVQFRASAVPVKETSGPIK